MTQIRENIRTDGRTYGQKDGQNDEQTLFYRTLTTTTRRPIDEKLNQLLLSLATHKL